MRSPDLGEQLVLCPAGVVDDGEGAEEGPNIGTIHARLQLKRKLAFGTMTHLPSLRGKLPARIAQNAKQKPGEDNVRASYGNTK